MRHLGLSLAALLALTAASRADTILFKDGFVLQGKLTRQLEPLIDPGGTAVFIPAAGKFFELDDEARRFVIVPGDFTEESGHLTPSMKLRREAVMRDFAAEVEGLYER